VSFDQDSDFTSAPSGSNMPNQWHGRFVTTAKSTTAEFVTVMRIGSNCTQTTTLAQPAAGADPGTAASSTGGKRKLVGGGGSVASGAPVLLAAAATKISGGYSLAVDGRVVTLIGDKATVN
jgi:hypothetical protein